MLEPELPRVAGHSCRVDDRNYLPDLTLPLRFTGLIVESLKTMRNSFGVLDGTLQLLKAPPLPLPLRLYSPLFYSMFCFPSRPVPLSASSISAGRLMQQIFWNIRCDAPNFTTAQQYHSAPARRRARPAAARCVAHIVAARRRRCSNHVTSSATQPAAACNTRSAPCFLC